MIRRLILRILSWLVRPSFAKAGRHHLTGPTVSVRLVPYNGAIWVNAEGDGGVPLDAREMQHVTVNTPIGVAEIEWRPKVVPEGD